MAWEWFSTSSDKDPAVAAFVPEEPVPSFAALPVPEHKEGRVERPDRPGLSDVAEVSGPVLYVSGRRVNMRAGPSTRFQVLGSLKRGTPVELLDDSHPAFWKVKTTFQRTPVWMSRSYLAESAG